MHLGTSSASILGNFWLFRGTQIERLIGFPESGRIVLEFGLANLREIIYPPFRIVYRLEERRICIIRLWRSERLLKLPDKFLDLNNAHV